MAKQCEAYPLLEPQFLRAVRCEADATTEHDKHYKLALCGKHAMWARRDWPLLACWQRHAREAVR